MDQSFQNPSKRSLRSSVYRNGVHDVAVPQEVLQRAGIDAVIS
jgi:hypothetical protein